MSETLIHSLATLKHLNVRKEGPDQEKVLALDIKLSGVQCSMRMLARLMGADDERDVRLAFWDSNEEPRFLGLDPIGSWISIRDCTIEMLGLTISGVIVRKFKVALAGEAKATMEFSISISNPPEKAVPLFAEYVAEDFTITIIKEQGELDLGATDIEVDPETGEIL